jgi:hypothetical protein
MAKATPLATTNRAQKWRTTGASDSPQAKVPTASTTWAKKKRVMPLSL